MWHLNEVKYTIQYLFKIYALAHILNNCTTVKYHNKKHIIH